VPQEVDVEASKRVLRRRMDGDRATWHLRRNLHCGSGGPAQGLLALSARRDRAPSAPEESDQVRDDLYPRALLTAPLVLPDVRLEAALDVHAAAGPQAFPFFPHTSTSCHSVSVMRWPECRSVQPRDVATRRFATASPPGVYDTSMSVPMKPTRITLFTMTLLPLAWTAAPRRRRPRSGGAVPPSMSGAQSLAMVGRNRR
jgi:hypothetical protein